MRIVRAAVLASTLLGLRACPGGTEPPRLERRAQSAPVDGAANADLALPPLHSVLGDPRAARANDRALARDWAGAARAFDEAQAALALGEAEACAWGYESARLHQLAGDSAEAAIRFDRVAGLSEPVMPCALAGYAALRAAQDYLKAGRYDEAVQRANAVPESISLHADARLAQADGLAGKGDRAAAVSIWRAHVARGGWVDVAPKLATALLDGADGDPAAHAEEALALAARVVVEVPKIADSSGAELARQRALALLRAKDPHRSDALSLDDRARQARAWLDASEPSKALAAANAVLGALPKSVRMGATPCAAATVRAQATVRLHAADAPDAWGQAIGFCEGEEGLVTALYAGGKASLNAKRLDEAAQRFALVEKRFSTHRFADDARLQGGLIALQRGDEAQFTTMLISLPDDYPQGDMRGEALFRVALLRMTKGDFAGAVPVLDRISTLLPDDRHWGTGGRAAYFRARAAAAAGDPSDAKARYLRVIAGWPLSFYMTLAYARVAQDDPDGARRALDEAASKEEAGLLLTHDHAELHSPGFQRAVRLLEVGESDAARHELIDLGVFAEHADPELLWSVALLYEHGGALELGRDLVRARLADFLPHYPAGRWRPKWEIAYPPAFELLVKRESAAHAIPTALTWAVMREESDFFPDAKSSANAYGLMQLIVPTARGVAAGTGLDWSEEGLKHPDVSIALGTKLLSSLRSSFAATPALAIAAYNGGAGAVNRWLAARGSEDFDLWVEEIPFEETRGYLKRVLASEAAYAFLYDHGSLDEVLAASRKWARGFDGGTTP